MNYKSEVTTIGQRAKRAARQLAMMSTDDKNRALTLIADEISAATAGILAQNQVDLQHGATAGLSAAMLDRLKLTPQRIQAIVQGVRDVVGLPDPVGHLDREYRLPNGLLIRKVRVPIGVIGIIYESRPNVTVDAAVLCLKAGNSVILRGGSESIYSNQALAAAMATGAQRAGLSGDAVQLLPWTDREAVIHLLKLNEYVDLVIPRGGEGLIRFVSENATVPVIKHYKGVCHIYIDESADLDMAMSIVENAKCQRPGVCNAVEKVLIHQKIAAHAAPRLGEMLTARGVELRGDQGFTTLVPSAKPATEKDWYEEYLDLILTVGIVPDVDAAIQHINTYGSAHSDAIITNDASASERFLHEVDSACVYVNASTRFTDGGQFGMGAEIGISTDKIHARGPMGLEELTSYKYTVVGTGQVRT